MFLAGLLARILGNLPLPSIYNVIVVVVFVSVVVFIDAVVFVLLTCAVLLQTPIGSRIPTSLIDRRT
jgi:hypothetical protein